MFPIEEQLHDKWCWAAVASSVDHYFFPASTFSQCIIANTVLGGNCCGSPLALGCNNTAYLQDALGAQVVNRLAEPPIPSDISFERVKEQIDQRIPVCVRIAWYGGGAHFVVISGYRISASGNKFVEVADPLFPNSLVPYDDFLDSYQNAEVDQGGGRWSATFLVSQAGGA